MTFHVRKISSDDNTGQRVWHSTILSKKTFAVIYSTLLVSQEYYLVRISNEFSIHKPYFKRTDSSNKRHWFVVQLSIISKQCNESREITVVIMKQTTDNFVQSIHFVDAYWDDDVRSCCGTTLHAYGAHPKRSHPCAKSLFASRICFGNLQTNTGKTYKHKKNTREQKKKISRHASRRENDVFSVTLQGQTVCSTVGATV